MVVATTSCLGDARVRVSGSREAMRAIVQTTAVMRAPFCVAFALPGHRRHLPFSSSTRVWVREQDKLQPYGTCCKPEWDLLQLVRAYHVVLVIVSSVCAYVRKVYFESVCGVCRVLVSLLCNMCCVAPVVSSLVSSSLRAFLFARGQGLTFTAARVPVRAPIDGPGCHNPHWGPHLCEVGALGPT